MDGLLKLGRRVRDRAVGLWRQLLWALRPGSTEAAMDEEHAFHIEMEAEKLVRQGVDPTEARRRAVQAFGGVERWQEEVREARWTAGLERLWLDTRYAFRTLARAPLLVLVVVVTLGVAIGAGTTVFSLVDAILLRPLDVPAADGLVGLEMERGERGFSGALSYPNYLDLSRGSEAVLQGLAAHSLQDIAVSDGERAQSALGVMASGNYFAVLGIQPSVGRFFGEAESEPGTAGAVAVISHAFWQSRFAGDPDVVGRELRVNGEAVTVIGVAPQGFHGALVGARPVAWLPLGLADRLLQSRVSMTNRSGWSFLQLFGRLATGTELERAEAALSAVANGMAERYEYPDHQVPGAVRLAPYKGLPPSAQESSSRVLYLLFAAALMLLLVAAVNVAGMQLARASARAREMGVRMALGAGRGRLIRQLGVEGVLLSLGGAAVGVGLAVWAGRVIGRIQPPGAAGFALELGLDFPLLMFAVAAGMLASLVFGVMPAFRATSGDVRTAVSDGDDSRAATRLRSSLVAGQVALTLVLLVSTGLLGRSLLAAATVDHGFEPEGVVMAEVNLRLNGYDEARGRAFYESLVRELEGAPEIEAAALTTSIPLGLNNDRTYAQVPGFEPPQPNGFRVAYAAVTRGYYRTIGLSLLAGTPPDPRTSGGMDGDDETVMRVVVNTAFAQQFWEIDEALGQPFTFFGADAVVAGVIPTGRYRSFSEEPTAYALMPFERSYNPEVQVLIRPTGTPGAAIGAFRRSLNRLDPYVPAINVTTLDRAMAQSLFLQEFAVTLVGMFAVVGLLLATTGIFGLLAYSVARRRREIGIRMAIGAARTSVIRSVVGTGLRPVLMGTALGLAGAIAVGGLLEAALIGVPPRDPVSFALSAAFVLGAAALATVVPARRATRVDPAAVLRVD